MLKAASSENETELEVERKRQWRAKSPTQQAHCWLWNWNATRDKYKCMRTHCAKFLSRNPLAVYILFYLLSLRSRSLGPGGESGWGSEKRTEQNSKSFYLRSLAAKSHLGPAEMRFTPRRASADPPKRAELNLLIKNDRWGGRRPATPAPPCSQQYLRERLFYLHLTQISLLRCRPTLHS